MPKIAFQKSDIITFMFLIIAVKYKDFALKFGMCVVHMYIYNIYSDFWDIFKILDLIGIHY